MTPAEDTCYQLQFDPDLHTNTFKINANATNAIAFFAEHVPIEFERDAHYLKDTAGEDIEPVAELPVTPEPEKPWGVAIGAAVIVNFVTIIGIIFLVPMFATLAKQYPAVL